VLTNIILIDPKWKYSLGNHQVKREINTRSQLSVMIIARKERSLVLEHMTRDEFEDRR
jgi:hypothetical protein